MRQRIDRAERSRLHRAAGRRYRTACRASRRRQDPVTTQPRQQHSDQQSDAAHSASRWEERYAPVEQLWSGHPNDWLPGLATDWSPGTALGIGRGEGVDVLWLVERGWQVVGLDLSATVIGCLTGQAEQLGAASRVTGRVHDAGNGLPAGPSDLVTSFYIHGGHEPGSLDLMALLSDAASRITPGEHLLTAVHAINPLWHTHHARTYTAAELLEGLAETTAGWEVVVGEEWGRQATGPDGQEGYWADAIMCLRRPPTSV